MSAHEDDDPGTEPCYRHPSEQTALRCVTCDRPICVDCAITAPVGFKCPDHGRASRAERGVVPGRRMLRGAGAGAVVALVLGVVLATANVPFLGIILAWLAGNAVGEVARRASGGYRDGTLARLAAAAAASGMLVLPIAWLVLGAQPGAWLAWQLVAAAAAAFGAHTRAS